MKKPIPDPAQCNPVAADPVADAARALLVAIRAEPMPGHLTALAQSLQHALDRRDAKLPSG